MSNSPKTLLVDPLSRGIATLAGMTGAILCRHGFWLLAAWGLFFLPILFLVPRFRSPHLRFLVAIWLPMALALVVVWGWVVGAPPGAAPHSAQALGLAFGATTAIRILVLAGLIQLCFLTIPANELVPTVRRWGLRGEALVVLMGTLSLIPELEQRARQVLAAQCARGLLKRNTWWHRALMMPRLLSPLMAWVLRTAIQRGETWEHRNLLAHMHEDQPALHPTTSWAGVSLSVMGLAWCAVNTLDHFGFRWL